MENNNNSSLSSGNAEGAQEAGGTQTQTQNGVVRNDGTSLLGIMNRSNNVVSFSHNISVKLDGNNFLLWKQQIDTAIHGYGLERHLTAEQIPPMFKNIQDVAATILNQEFVNWRRQDQLLMSWILASMSEAMLTRIVGCNFVYEIWEKVRIHFASQTRAKVKQFKT